VPVVAHRTYGVGHTLADASLNATQMPADSNKQGPEPWLHFDSGQVSAVGDMDGDMVGKKLGKVVGASVGEVDGDVVGDVVGASVGQVPHLAGQASIAKSLSMH